MATRREEQARLLVGAIDELLDFVENAHVEVANGFSYGFTRPGYKEFLSLDQRVAALSSTIRLPLPSFDKLKPSLREPVEKPAEFIGLSNLPGDWDNGFFHICLNPWQEEMHGIRACAEHIAKDVEMRPQPDDAIIDLETKTSATGGSGIQPARKGDARELIIAALNEHHKYCNGSCIDVGHVGVNKLARNLGISSSTVSEFFKNEFGSHRIYKNACSDVEMLSNSLKLLNGEYSPIILFDRVPGENFRSEDD